MAKTGIWEKPSEKILPGIYNRMMSVVNVYGEGLVGTMAMPVKANWGPVGEVVTVPNDINKLKALFGDDLDSKYTAFRLGSLLLKTKIKYLKLYRLADSSAKQSTISLKNSNEAQTDIIKLTSKYATSKELNVTIKKNLVNDKAVDLYVYDGSKLLAKIFSIKGTVNEMVSAINTAYDNHYIIAEKISESTDPLAEISNQKLTGGDDGCSNITNQLYIDALDQFARTKIDGFALDGKEDESLDASVFAWIKSNYESGRTILYFNGIGQSEELTNAFTKARKINDKLYTLVASSGIIDDVEYTPSETAAYLCAEEISNKLKESSCNKKTAFTSVKKVFTTPELEEAQRVGVLTLDVDENDIVIVDDINTYKNYPEDKKFESILGYNRTVRTVSAINEMLIVAGKEIIGKVDNDPEIGHDIIISAFKKGFEYLVAEGAIKEFTVEVDKELQASAMSDELYFKWTAVRKDKVKRLYGSGTIR